MGGFWMDKEIQDQLNLWLSRLLVILSFMAHLALALFAEFRRREDSGWRRKLVWFAYQVSDMAPKAALGKLYLDSPSDHQFLFAFWVPFLLLHLGLPDNISAYSLEDNKLSARKIAEITLQLVGAVYGAYKQRFMSSDRVLCSAFFIMFFLGSYKCVEMPFALWRGGFVGIRSTYKNKVVRRFSPAQNGSEQLDDYYALLDAHGLLGISMGAFADYSVKGFEFKKSPVISYSYWHDVVKLVEMELSLMYDMMYTKATVIHTRPGYIIRALSPPLTATALLLFHFHSKAGQKEVDIKITYMLLIGTFLLDVRWLLRSLISTWTYAFLQGTECKLLKKTICCRRGRWYGLRGFVFSLDPSRFFRFNKQISSHRMWSRTIGQLNFFRECTGGSQPSRIGWEPESGIRSILAVNICKEILKEASQQEPKTERYEFDQSYRKRRKFGDAMYFGPDFDQLVLTWHIATDIFLLCTPESEAWTDYWKIKAISDYLMLLAIDHPGMLPGPKNTKRYQETRQALCYIIMEGDYFRHSGGRESEKKLAGQLREMGDRLYNISTMLAEATKYAKVLELLYVPDRTSYKESDWDTICDQVMMQEESERKLLIFVPELQDYALERNTAVGWPLKGMLSLILRSWVRLLIFASIGCSRDSHAKQLSCGGELTTVIWILHEHREIVGYRKPIENID